MPCQSSKVPKVDNQVFSKKGILETENPPKKQCFLDNFFRLLNW